MVRTYDARVDVYRDGARVTSLRFLKDSPPEVTCSQDAVIRMGLRGEFLRNAELDYLNDELRPVQIIDGVEHPCGVFHISAYQDKIGEEGRMQSIEAYDKCFLLQSTTTEDVLRFAAGTKYLTAIENLLTAAGIGLYIMTPSNATLQTDREDWEIGTNYLEIVNELLVEINYAPIWFDANGYGVIEPKTEPSAENIKHTYKGTDVTSVLSYNATSSVDIFGKPNVFICICENPDLPAPLIARAENNSPLSSLSTIKRGRRIAKTFKVDNIASQADLQTYVDDLMFQSMLSAETLSITTANMPGHGVGDTVAILHPEISGIFRETGWKISLGPGKLMSHDLQRMVVF